jgi:hypothetical protein
MPLLSGEEASDRGGGSAFPLSVRATLMDSALISAGIEVFANLSSMSAEEASRFRTSYERTFIAGDSIFVWVEMQTTSTEEYLQLDRWTMFLEDGEGRQVEPGRIVQHPLRRQRSNVARANAANDREFQEPEYGSRVWEPVTKDVQLYFPASRPPGAQAAPSHARKMKFVLLDPRNPAIRAEGEWPARNE